MTDFEALMWRAEADPRLRSHGVLLDILDHAPDPERLRSAHAWAVQAVPRLRQRVVDDPLRLRPPSWRDTEVDLNYHLTRVRLAADAGVAGALELAAALHMSQFDVARPLWQAMLVEGLPDGKAAYLLKLHHSMSDGQGIMQLFDLLYAPGPDPADDPSWRGAPTGLDEEPEPTAADELRGALGVAWRAVGGAGGMARRAIADPSEALAYARSLPRVLNLPGTPSPLLSERSLGRRVRILECSLADLRAAGRAVGGSVNDAYLAAMIGGLGRYHAKHGTPVGDLPVALPVSTRTKEDVAGGNKFAGAFIAGPAGEADPARRIALIRDRVRTVRDEPALDFMGGTSGLTSRLPTPVLTAMTLRVSSGLNLQASNIPGMTRPAYLAGARIERMFPFGPVPGSAMMATMVTHEGTCCIGVTTDHAAVPDPDLLNDCMRAALDEVLSLAGKPND